jgi:hypothetical protein
MPLAVVKHGVLRAVDLAGATEDAEVIIDGGDTDVDLDRLGGA